MKLYILRYSIKGSLAGSGNTMTTSATVGGGGGPGGAIGNMLARLCFFFSVTTGGDAVSSAECLIERASVVPVVEGLERRFESVVAFARSSLVS